MKKILLALLAGTMLWGCSKGGDDPPGNQLVTDVVMPEPTTLFASGATITIEGKGFTNVDVIFFSVTRAVEEVTAPITSVSSTQITFTLPSGLPDGQNPVLLSRAGETMELGKITVKNNDDPDPAEVWDGTAVQPADLDRNAKTASIRNGRELAWLAQNCTGEYGLFFGYTFTQTNDIDLGGLEWTPIGTYNAPFEGVYDGAGFTIANLTLTDASKDYRGLFGYQISGSLVKAVSVVSGRVVGNDYVGAICGCAYKGKVSDCTNTASVTGNKYVGGIAGGNKSTAVMSGCTNSGNITGVSYVGGIAGENNSAYNDSRPMISGCVNSGSVTGSGYYTGGITGICHKAMVENCRNSGNVSGAELNTGGVAGCVMNLASAKNCLNTGPVSGGSYTGGVTGKLWHPDTWIMGCINRGNVTGTYPSGTEAFSVGGVVGYIDFEAGLLACYNTGNIKAVSGTAVNQSGVGGVAGTATMACVIAGCYSANTSYDCEDTDAPIGTICGYVYNHSWEDLGVSVRYCYASPSGDQSLIGKFYQTTDQDPDPVLEDFQTLYNFGAINWPSDSYPGWGNVAPAVMRTEWGITWNNPWASMGSYNTGTYPKLKWE